MAHERIPNVLSIAGSDPSGGAGVQADLKAFSALGAYGMCALTALTAQNTTGVRGVSGVDPEFLRDQIEAVFDDVRVDAVKIGMVGSAASVAVVSECLAHYRPAVVVVDPVMVAKSGDRLIDDAAVVAMRERLLPLASLVTPNLPETAVLLGEDDAPATCYGGGGDASAGFRCTRGPGQGRTSSGRRGHRSALRAGGGTNVRIGPCRDRRTAPAVRSHPRSRRWPRRRRRWGTPSRPPGVTS